MPDNRWFIVSLLVMVVGVMVLAPASAQITDLGYDDPVAAQAMIGKFNEWRLAAGVPPLKPNAILKAMAIEQASYLGSLSEITGGNAMHIGRNGETVRERALYPQFNWPTYGGQPAITEVGAAGSEAWALEFWQGSDIHRETITNPVLREIGMAAVTHPWGHIYIAVLGSRPDVLPALVDPSTQMLYLTQDLWKFGVGNAPPTQVFLFDAEGRPLNGGAGQTWAAMIPVPIEAVGKVYVLYDDGASKSLMEVDLIRDQVILPGYTPMMETPIATAEF